MKNLTVRLRHPSKDAVLTLELPRDTLLQELIPVLYEKGFVEPQKGDYRFLIQGHLCNMTHPLGHYVPETAGEAELQVFPYALIMV